jgi:hypothetical protein
LAAALQVAVYVPGITLKVVILMHCYTIALVAYRATPFIHMHTPCITHSEKAASFCTVCAVCTAFHSTKLQTFLRLLNHRVVGPQTYYKVTTNEIITHAEPPHKH